MSASPEARFAAGYIRREKRERLLHELTDPQNGIGGWIAFAITRGS